MGARQPWTQAPLQLDSSALLWSAPPAVVQSALVWSGETSLVFCCAAPAPETQPLMKEESVLSQPEGRRFMQTKAHTLNL